MENKEIEILAKKYADIVYPFYLCALWPLVWFRVLTKITEIDEPEVIKGKRK